MDRVPLSYESDPGAGLAVCLLFGDTPCVFVPCWLVDSPPSPRLLWPPGSCCLWCLGTHRWSSRSQQHTVFMQRGGTSAPLQWNAQINSPLLAVLPAEETHGSSEYSGARGGVEVEFSVHPQNALAGYTLILHYPGSWQARGGRQRQVCGWIKFRVMKSTILFLC